LVLPSAYQQPISRLALGEDELVVARQLLRAKAKRTAFSGPISYENWGIA
jgi:hypothetical protein